MTIPPAGGKVQRREPSPGGSKSLKKMEKQSSKLHICPRQTIWGEVQHQEQFAPGVWDVCTAGHGGIIVAVEVAKKYISEKARSLVAPPENGYYHFEEDCAWALFAKENPGIVPQRWLEHVDRTLDAYYPEYNGGQLSLGLNYA